MTNPSSDVVERTVAQAINEAHRFACGLARPFTDAEAAYLARKAIAAMPTIERLSAERGERDAEILRLVDALVFAHDAGIEWPIDPLPFGSIAHNLFIERGNDPDRIAAMNAHSMERLPAERLQLREALKPFAAMADYLDDTAQQRDAIYCGGVPGIKCEVTQADYHRARAALSNTAEDTRHD